MEMEEKNVKIYYSTMNGSAIAVEHYDYKEFMRNYKNICNELLTYDDDPMDLSISVFSENGYFLYDFNYDKNSGNLTKYERSV